MPNNYNKIQDNQMLICLSQGDPVSILPYLELVPLDIGERLIDAGEKMSYAYFPISGIITFLYSLENGSTAEIGIVGREGFCGIPLLTGEKTMPYDVVVQGKGEAYRMPANKLNEFFNSSIKFRNIVLRFCQTLITQVSQTAVCNRHHPIEQQLCRWLLLMLDRVEGIHLNMTQEVIAIMLGVRREGISEAAARLRDEGIIKYQRGLIQVLNRSRLEHLCCECYAVVRNENKRLFPSINKL